jgi:drug/metabolite transporter (DMT)-like permease
MKSTDLSPSHGTPGERRGEGLAPQPAQLQLPSSSRRFSPNQGAAILLLVTASWGASFVVIKLIVSDVPAGRMNLARFAIAAIALSPFIRPGRRMWRKSLEMSIWMFAGFALQSLSLKFTTINRSAFITAMNVIFVPMIGLLFGKRVRPLVWAAALTAITGCGLLCGAGGKPNIGDLISLGTAITWAAYIFQMESAAAQFAPLPLAASQVFIVMIFSGIWAAGEPGRITAYHWPALIFLGLGATAMTAWLQAVAQRVVPAPQAAVIFTLEPVFAAVLGFIMLGETLTIRGMAGAALIVTAAIACQLPSSRQEMK